MVTPTATSTIVTQAFRFMEVKPPSSLADNSPKASDASEQYDIALRICLEQEDFSFARRIRDLPSAVLSSNETPDAQLPFVFKVPSDLVALRSVRNADIRWRLDSDLIRANVDAPLGIMYTKLITNEKRLPATFQTAVSYQLANLLAPIYVGSRTKRADLMSDGASAMQRAIRNDAVSASHANWDANAVTGDWASDVTR